MNRLVVLGAGESGMGTAILGKKKGFEVFVSDLGIIKNTYKQVLLHHEISWEEGGQEYIGSCTRISCPIQTRGCCSPSSES